MSQIAFFTRDGDMRNRWPRISRPHHRVNALMRLAHPGYDDYYGPNLPYQENDGIGIPASAQAARTVLASRQAIVIGPTPPGTGVMAPATCAASAKQTSPTSRDLPPSSGSRLMPISI